MKICLKKVTLQIGFKNFLWLKTLKILYCGHLISDIKGEEIVLNFYESELQKAYKKEFRF